MDKEQLRIIMGKNIRKERLARNMTVEQLSEFLEQSSGFVNLIEGGKRGISSYTLLKLSEALNVSIDSIFRNA